MITMNNSADSDISTPLVSIITPAYNHEHFIAECIESVLAQTYTNWEMIIVDDGSTDATWDVVQRYAAKDARVRAFHQENVGIWRLSETYNFALSQARGSLIAILEGDDYWHNSKLETQVPLFVSHNNLNFAYSNTVYIDNNKKTLDIYTPPFQKFTILDSLDFMKRLLLRKNMIFPATVMLRRDAIDSINGFFQPEYPALDYPTWLRISSVPGIAIYDDKILAYYRQHQNQITRVKSVEMMEGRLNIAINFYNGLPNNTKEILNISLKEIQNSHLFHTDGMYLELLRESLLLREKGRVFMYATRLFKSKSIKRKTQALYGIVMSLMKRDMEHVFNMYEVLWLRK